MTPAKGALGRLGLCLALTVMCSGCEWIFLAAALSSNDDTTDDYDDFDDHTIPPCPSGRCDDGITPTGPVVAPTVDLEVLDFPPLGTAGFVTVTATSPSGLNRAEAQFQQRVARPFGTTNSIRFVGEELGEGMGTLTVDVFGANGARTTRFIDRLLVDLSPPQAFVDREVVVRASGGDLEFYVGDAWVLSGWELKTGEVNAHETFPEGYPSTLGKEWDYSYVKVPLPALPVGEQVAKLKVMDAAGNSANYDVVIHVDGLAPTANFLAPSEGAVVSGQVDIAVEALDELPFPTRVEIFVAGTSLSAAPGPKLALSVNTADYPNGPTELTAIATDAAGNESVVAARTITIANP